MFSCIGTLRLEVFINPTGVIMKILISELENAANAVGLRLKPCNDHHYQLIGGSKLVNFYVTNKGSSKIYVEGEPNGMFVNSVAQVIDATGAKQQSKPSAPTNILEHHREPVRHRDGTAVTQGSFNHLMCRLDTLEVKAKELDELRDSLTDYDQCAHCKRWKLVEEMLLPHGRSEDLCCDQDCCDAWYERRG